MKPQDTADTESGAEWKVETAAEAFSRAKWFPVVSDSVETECEFDFDPGLCLNWLCQEHVYFVESNGRITKDEADKYHVISSSISCGPPWSAEMLIFDVDAQHDLFVFFRMRAT